MRWALWGLIALNVLQGGYIVSRDNNMDLSVVPVGTQSVITLPQSDISPIAGQVLSVRRGVFSEFMESSQALRSVAFAPWPRGGFLATRIEPGSLVARLGLKKGDIVTSVNNTELSSVLHALSVYQDLQTLQFLEVRLERENQQKSLFYKLID